MKALSVGDIIASIGYANPNGENIANPLGQQKDYFRLFRVDSTSKRKCRASCINSKRLLNVVFTVERYPYYVNKVPFYHFVGNYNGVDGVFYTPQIEQLYNLYSQKVQLKSTIKDLALWGENLSPHIMKDYSKLLSELNEFLKNEVL